MVDSSQSQAFLADLEQFLPSGAEETAADLESFAHLLRSWGRAKNLVSRETMQHLWSRHIADSLHLLPLITENDLHVLDLGSGGGFPALPLAIALKKTSTHFTLIESNGRKGSFLRTVTRNLGLNARVLTARFEALDRDDIGPVDVITARAVASVDGLCAISNRFWSLDRQSLRQDSCPSATAPTVPFPKTTWQHCTLPPNLTHQLLHNLSFR